MDAAAEMMKKVNNIIEHLAKGDTEGALREAKSTKEEKKEVDKKKTVVWFSCRTCSDSIRKIKALHVSIRMSDSTAKSRGPGRFRETSKVVDERRRPFGSKGRC